MNGEIILIIDSVEYGFHSLGLAGLALHFHSGTLASTLNHYAQSLFSTTFPREPSPYLCPKQNINDIKLTNFGHGKCSILQT
uniref:Uncharacterized protein n=1 Tax=Octopus bimaculoides TaxID=37653 RepID=A0A0L8HK10_OCTBM